MNPVSELGDIGAQWLTTHNAGRRAVVFIHGWQGDHFSTWARRPLLRKIKKGLIDYLSEDALFPWQYYAVKHSAGTFSATTIRDLANLIRTFLEIYVYPNADNIVLIAHSLGGLACRQLIVDEFESRDGRTVKIQGLLMFGTPNDGASMGKAASSIFWSGSAAQMATYSDTLRDLNTRWLENVTNGGNRTSLRDRPPLLCWNVVGTSDWVVTAASAAHLALIGDVRTITKDHRSLTKPVAANDMPVELTKAFLRAAFDLESTRAKYAASESLVRELRERVQIHPWVREEIETITLREIPSVSTAPNPPRLFRSTVEIQRFDVSCSNEFRVGIRLSQPHTIQYDCVVDYDLQIGDGVLGNAVSEDIRRGIDMTKLASVASVKRLVVKHNGVHTFAQDDVRFGHGWCVICFRCPTLPLEAGRAESIEFELESTIDLAMGWYTYVARRTTTEKLVVNFRCPLKVACLLHPPLHGRAQTSYNSVVDSLFASTVVVSEAVAAGTRLTFVFER